MLFFLCFFPNHLKMYKAFLAHRPYKTGSRLDLAYRPLFANFWARTLMEQPSMVGMEWDTIECGDRWAWRANGRETVESLRGTLNLVLWITGVHWRIWNWGVIGSELYFRKTSVAWLLYKSWIGRNKYERYWGRIHCWLSTYVYEGENDPHLYLCLSKPAFQVFILEGFSLCPCQVGSPICVNSQNLEFTDGSMNSAFLWCWASFMACAVLSSPLYTMDSSHTQTICSSQNKEGCLLASIHATCCAVCLFALNDLVNTD